MLLVGVGLVVLYIAGVRRVRRPWPTTRSLAFGGGCAALVVSALLPSSSFTAHMVEHVLIGMAAPVLLVLGAPITLALQSAGPTTARTLRHVLRSDALRVVTHPIAVWMLFGVTLVALVFSPLLEWSVQNDAVHALVHLHFLVAGFVFASALLAVDPVPHPLPHGARLLAVLLAVPFHAIVGMALAAAARPVFPSTYPSLSDQRSAAAVLWASGELFTLAIAAVVARQWWLADQRAAARSDRSFSRQ